MIDRDDLATSPGWGDLEDERLTLACAPAHSRTPPATAERTHFAHTVGHRTQYKRRRAHRFAALIRRRTARPQQRRQKERRQPRNQTPRTSHPPRRQVLSPQAACLAASRACVHPPRAVTGEQGEEGRKGGGTMRKKSGTEAKDNQRSVSTNGRHMRALGKARSTAGVAQERMCTLLMKGAGAEDKHAIAQ